MFKVNEYFDGKVKSIGFENSKGKTTIGVMTKGEYTFATSSVEYMTIISGEMTVLLPDNNEWQTFKTSETFIVDKNKEFKLKINENTAYLCEYK